MGIISPEVSLRAFRPFDDQPVEIPMDVISRVSSSRSFGPGSISLKFARGASQSSIRKIYDILEDQTVVQLRVKRKPSDSWRQLNIAYVDSGSLQAEANSEESWSPELQTLDAKLSAQKYFISLPNGASSIPPGQQAGLPEGSFPRAMLQFTESLEDGIKSIRLLLENFWDDIVVYLMNPETYGSLRVVYGGKRLISKIGEPSATCFGNLAVFQTESYTEQFVSFFNYMSQISVGASPNFYQIMSSMATPPLYEFFYDPLEGDGVLDESNQYNVPSGHSKFVFRKTPFWNLFDDKGKWIPATNEIDSVHRVSANWKSSDIYTGVHVGLSMFDDQGNTVVFTPKWSGLLGATHGHRPLQIKLDGLSPNGVSKKNIIDSLKAIQDMLFLYFCEETVPRRNASIVADATFNFYRVGAPYSVELPETLKGDIAPYLYTTSVLDEFDIQNATASSKIQGKWVDRLSGIPAP